MQGPPARQGKTCTGLSAPANMSSLFAFVKSRLDYLGPTVYCETPEELRTRHLGLYAHAYSAEPPAEARVSERDVSLELGRTPMRGTSGKIASPMGSWHSLPRSSFHHVLSALRGFQNPVPDRSPSEDIGLTIFGPLRPAQSRFALTDAVQQCPGAPGTLPVQGALTGASQQHPGAPGTQGAQKPAAADQSFLDSQQGQATDPKAGAAVDSMLAHLTDKAQAAAGKAKVKARAKATAQRASKAKGKGKPKATCKAKGKGKPKATCKAKGKGKAKAKAKLVLGCSKCRYSGGGCGVCRNPSFSGKRGRP